MFEFFYAGYFWGFLVLILLASGVLFELVSSYFKKRKGMRTTKLPYN